eukprot:6379583-Prymnesium_polylepis.2
MHDVGAFLSQWSFHSNSRADMCVDRTPGVHLSLRWRRPVSARCCHRPCVIARITLPRHVPSLNVMSWQARSSPLGRIHFTGARSEQIGDVQHLDSR